MRNGEKMSTDYCGFHSRACGFYGSRFSLEAEINKRSDLKCSQCRDVVGEPDAFSFS